MIIVSAVIIVITVIGSTLLLSKRLSRQDKLLGTMLLTIDRIEKRISGYPAQVESFSIDQVKHFSNTAERQEDA